MPGEFDPSEIEQVASTPPQRKLTGRDGKPIVIGDVVYIYSGYEEDGFLAKVIGSDRGLMQVKDTDENVIDVYPYEAETIPKDEWYRMESGKFEKWTGVDLDGTLAKSSDKFDPDKVGEPIQAMVKRVKSWLKKGKIVKIFTARAGDKEFDPSVIKAWCTKHLGQELEITNEKDPGMEELWDDRAVQVVKNTGKVVEDFDPEEIESVAGSTLGATWVKWFKDQNFNYTPEDGTFYKKWHDPYMPAWSYIFKVVPIKFRGEDAFDLVWSYLDESDGVRREYSVFHRIQNVELDTVENSLKWGLQLIRKGGMPYEVTHI